MAKMMIEILGNATSAKRAFEESGSSAGKFSGVMSKMSGVAKLGGLALVGGLAYGLDKSVKAAMSAQASQASLDQSLRRTHQSVTAMKPAIDAAEAASRKLGFSDEDTAQAMARLELATGSTKKSVSELSVAEDIARTRHMDLSSAANTLAQAQTGSQRAAKQLGIIVVPVTKNLDALKASNMNLKTETGKLAEAHAKLLDKMATGQNVIKAVTDKVKGQAAAFAGTAAGGAAAFRAELEHLEVTVGTALLPALTKITGALTTFIGWLSSSPSVAKVATDALGVFKDVMSTLVAVGKDLLAWYQDHQTAAKAIILTLAAVALAFSGPITIVVALGVALIELYKRSQTFRDIVNEVFDSVRNKIEQVMPTIKAIIVGVITTVQALWQTWGSTIMSVASTAFHTVEQLVRDAFSIIGSVFSLIGDLIHGRWGQVWNDLKNIVGKAWDAVKTLISGEVQILATIGEKVGKELINGVKNGIEGAAKGVYDSAKNFVSKAKSVLEFWHSPPGDYGKWIGSEISQGLIDAWIAGTAQLPAKLSQTIKNAVAAAQAEIAKAQTAFQTSFSGMSSMADNMFQGVSGAKTTKSGRELAKMQAADAQKQLNDTLATAKQATSDAQAALDAYNATAAGTADQLQAVADATSKVKLAQDSYNAAVTKYGTSSDQALRAQLALTSAQKGLATAQGNVGIDPAKQAQLQQAVVQATAQQVAAQRAIKEAALTKDAAAEQKQLDAQNATRQIAFDKALSQLQTHLAKTHASTKTAMEAITKLLKSYGITFSAVGRAMGIAWVQALKDAILEAAQGSGDLSSTISKAGSGIHIPKAATGGYVAGTGLAIIHKGETIIPAGKGGGPGVTVNVNVNGTADAAFARMLGDQLALQLRGGRLPALATAIGHL